MSETSTIETFPGNPIKPEPIEEKFALEAPPKPADPTIKARKREFQLMELMDRKLEEVDTDAQKRIAVWLRNKYAPEG